MSLISRLWDGLVNPTVRLKPDFPLSGLSMGKAYFVALFWFIVGTLFPLVLFFGLLFILAEFYPSAAADLIEFMVDRQGQPNISFMMVMSVVTFLSGFGLELRYLRRHLATKGVTLSGAMALNLDALPGKTVIARIGSLLGFVGISYALWFALETALGAILTAPAQPTAELARQAVGGNFVAFALLAAVAAPFFEEVVFRGFLFQALRTSLHKGRLFAWLGNRKGLADFLAVTVSAAIFSVQHMQFHPVTLLLLFLMGCMLAEVYRRSGSLWVPIVLHAVSNGIAVVALGMA